MAVLKSQLQLSLLDRVSGPLRGITGRLAAFQNTTRTTMSPMTAAIGRVAAFGASYLGATAGISGTLGAAREMQAALTEIGIKADLSSGQLNALRGKVLALSPTVNQTSADLLTGIDTMVGLGLSANDAAAAIPAIGKAATATGATMADLSAATVSAMQNLKVNANDIPRMLDAMASAGNAGAFELRDMAREIPSLGAAYQGLGQSGVSAVTDLAAALQIVRKGTGDSSSAATNLTNILQKVNAPQTRAAFKKMGVNLSREMTKASKKGMTPIEAIAEITNKTLKGDLSKLGDLFSDSQVQQGLRPLIQNMEEYRRIREAAARATGTIADAFAARMGNADEKIKAFQIRMNNLGASIGVKLMEPLGKAAEYLSGVFDSLDRRVTVFDKINAAMTGFMSGLGLDGGTAFKQISDFLFGVAGDDGVKAGEELGALATKFRLFGESVKSFATSVTDNPVGKFITELAASIGVLAVSKWGQLFIVAAGVASLISAVQGSDSIGEFVDNLSKLSALEWVGIGGGLLILAGRVTKLIGLFKTLKSVTPKGVPIGTSATNGGTIGKTLLETAKATMATVGGALASPAGLAVIAAAAAAFVTGKALISSGPSDPSLVQPGRGAEKDNYYRRFHGVPFEGGMHRTGLGAGPSPGGTLPPAPALTMPAFPVAPPGPLPLTKGDLSSVTLSTRPTGVQTVTGQVTVTNPIRPNASVSVTVNNTSGDPGAIGAAVGAAVKSELETSFGGAM